MITQIERQNFRELESAWEAMGPQATPFVTFPWLSAWLDHYGTDEHVAIVDRNGSRITSGAVFARRDGVMTQDLAEIPWPGFAKAAGTDAYAAILAHLRQDRGLRSVELARARADEAERLDRSAQGGFQRTSRHSRESRGIDIGSDFEAYLGERPKKVRSELRRKDRNLEKALPGARLVTIKDAQRAFAIIEDVERDSWKDEEQTSIIATAADSGFYREVLGFDRPDLHSRLHVLMNGDEPIAYVLCTIYGRVNYALKTSFRQTYANLSPGTALFFRLLQQESRDDRDADRIELLGNDAQWKRHFSTSATEICTHELWPLSLRGRAIAFAQKHVKPWVKSNPRLNALYTAVRRRIHSDLS